MTRNTRFIAIIIVLLAFVVSAIPAEETGGPRSFEEFSKALGVYYGEAGGTGLSYHRWLPETSGSGFNVAAGLVYFPIDQSDYFWGNVLDYTVGLEYQQRLYGEDFLPWLTGSLYVWGGVCHRGYIGTNVISEAKYDENYNLISPQVIENGDFAPTVTVGAGIGVELILFRHLSFPFEVGYAATYNFLSGTDVLGGLSVNLVPQVGARYRY